MLAGILCLILQISVIGWLPAAIWAVVAHSNARNDKKLKEMENRILASRQ
jgi:type IV secretory pathway TrbD component